MYKFATLSGPVSRDTATLSLRYPISPDTFSGRLALPQNGAILPAWYLVSHRHVCAMFHFAAYRAIIIVRYPRKTSRGNKRAVSWKGGFGERALVPVFGTGQNPNVPSFRFLVPGNIRMYPCSFFWYREHPLKPPFWKPPFCDTPKQRPVFFHPPLAILTLPVLRDMKSSRAKKAKSPQLGSDPKNSLRGGSFPGK